MIDPNANPTEIIHPSPQIVSQCLVLVLDLLEKPVNYLAIFARRLSWNNHLLSNSKKARGGTHETRGMYLDNNSQSPSSLTSEGRRNVKPLRAEMGGLGFKSCVGWHGITWWLTRT